jgi:hypothetical protein
MSFWKKNCPYKKLSFCSQLLKNPKIHVNLPILVLKVEQKFEGNFRHNFYGKTFLDSARNQFFDSFFDHPFRTFCLKTSLFRQIHPPKFLFSGSITHHKLTFKIKIGKFTCIFGFFRSCEQKHNFLYGQFLLSTYIKYLRESIGLTPKILKKNFFA